jgi:ERCC4-related helicase
LTNSLLCLNTYWCWGSQATAAVPHPKLQVLVEVLQRHVAAAPAAVPPADGDGGRAGDVSRVIIFCSYRDQVALVLQHLKQLEPEIMCR